MKAADISHSLGRQQSILWLKIFAEGVVDKFIFW
jgi:hypothetical protein